MSSKKVVTDEAEGLAPFAELSPVIEEPAEGTTPKTFDAFDNEIETPTVAPQYQDATPQAGEGQVVLRYEGGADLLEYGEYKFRPGKQVIVEASVAEELLTLPFETFKVQE